jgi:Acetoacetate decarboxylase (ADC)
VIVAAHYATSPVGSYLELAVSEPARVGARVGMCVTTMAVNSSAALRGGQENWGFPKELGTLHWSVEGEDRALYWEERGIVMRGVVKGSRPIPAVLPYGSLQRRADGPLWVSGRVRASARFGRVELVAPGDDRLSFLEGRHWGALFSNVILRMGEGRPLSRPAGRR